MCTCTQHETAWNRFNNIEKTFKQCPKFNKNTQIYREQPNSQLTRMLLI